MRVIIVDPDPRRPWLEERSRRSLTQAGPCLAGSNKTGILLIRAGVILAGTAGFRLPPNPAGRPLIAVGLPAEGEWLAFHQLHGGSYPNSHSLPAPVCEWHSQEITATARLAGNPLDSDTRVIHWPALDPAPTDERLCVWEIVTSLQHGGAERIALDLATTLPEFGRAVRLVVLGKPHRGAYPAPAGTLDLSHLPRSERAGILAVMAVKYGADVLHVHLTDAEETRTLTRSGVPVMASVHNARPGWPRDWESLRESPPALMLACSLAVEAEVRKALPDQPTRTVWNGIHPNAFPETPLPSLDGGVILACVANPRPQKRLELLPDILVATREEFVRRGFATKEVRLVIAGEAAPTLADALDCRAAVDARAKALGVEDMIRWTDGRCSVREVLAGCHALVSCSAYEGLSLAHLEAMSSGRPLVACDSGGTRELDFGDGAVRLVDVDARPAVYATAIADVVISPSASAHKMVWRNFTAHRMSERVSRFAGLTASRGKNPETVWIVTNNLSMGGAQSSLRRLAKAMRISGRAVKIALLQEYPEHPTPGRLDMLDHGIEVFTPPPCGTISATEAIDLILAEMAVTPPRVVVFWNAITSHKMLLADSLPFTRIVDVSPGEMWFSSFEDTMGNLPLALPCRVPSDYGRLLDAMVVKYAAEAEQAARLGCKVEVIPNGVPVPDAPLPRKISGGSLVFGTAARISPQKYLHELIAAFRVALPDLPGAVLRIAGGVDTGADACASDLLRQSQGLPIEWLGEIRDIARFHAECDVFVMISDPAGCPNASLEALAAGLPVIATDVGGASEQVLDGINGYLVPARDVNALGAAMVRIAGDPDARQRMSTAAHQHVRKHFSLERMTDDYLRVFEC